MQTASVQNLTKVYRRPRKERGFWGTIKGFWAREVEEVVAIKRISFELNKGEILGFVGPNGAGKTTTLKILSGVLFPDSGIVNVLGFTPQKREKELLKRMTFVMGQEGFLEEVVWDLSARDGLHFIKDLYGIDQKVFQKNFFEMTELLETTEYLDVPLRRLSKGQKMRIELIGSLIFSPEVLFLDEPTLGLDVVSQQKIRDFVKKYVRERKASCILTSHYMRDVEDMADRLILIDKGQIVYEGNVANVIKKFTRQRSIEVSFSKKISGAELSLFKPFEEENGIYRFLVDRKESSEFVRSLMEKFPVTDITVEEPDLEEVLREYFFRTE